MIPDAVNDSLLWGPVLAFGVFVLLTVVSGVAYLGFSQAIRRQKDAPPGDLRVRVLSTLRGPVVLFFVILGAFWAAMILTQLTHPRLTFLAGARPWAQDVWTVVVIAEVTYLLYRVAEEVMTWYIRTVAVRTTTRLDDRLLPPLKRLLPLLVYSAGALVALTAVGIPISPIWAGLGIGGLAVALAVQPTLANFFAGTYVVTEGELNIGDYIEIEGGPSGYVVEVGWRSTKIRSFYNNLIIIPNSRMAESIVTNYYTPTRAINVLVYCGVSYDSELAKVERTVLETTNQVLQDCDSAVKASAPFFGFEEFGDSNITFWVFVQARDRLGSFVLKSELIKAIHARLVADGIEINYPVRKLVYPSPNGTPATLPGGLAPGSGAAADSGPS